MPLDSADMVREALGQAGAGQIGEYRFCSYSVVGNGRFIPSDNANPHIGARGVYETVDEERVEVECDRSHAKIVIVAMKKAHPYEEVVFDIYPLLEESEL